GPRRARGGDRGGARRRTRTGLDARQPPHRLRARRPTVVLPDLHRRRRRAYEHALAHRHQDESRRRLLSRRRNRVSRPGGRMGPTLRRQAEELTVNPSFSSLVLSLAALSLCVSGAARGADDPVTAAMKLYEKRRYEQAGRLLEDARFDGERGAQAQLVLGMTYLRNAALHEAFARAAAAAELDYLDKLTKAGGEGRSRYARLYLAEALLARGNAPEAARQFERVRGDAGVDANYRSIAGVGPGAAFWAQGDTARARKLWGGGTQQDAVEVRLARAAAQGRAGVLDSKILQRVGDDARGTKDLSPRARPYLVPIYLAAGAPERAPGVGPGADLGAASY